jgi:hypothetical protein
MSKQVKLTREELYAKVWQKPTVKLAEEYGVSDVMIAKLCRKMDIPKPPLGYWRRIETGAKIEPTPLPKATDKTEIYAYINAITDDDIVKLSPEVQAIVDKEALAENQIKIADNFNDAHQLVIKTKQYIDKTETKDEFGPVALPRGKGFPDLSVSRSQAERALLIMDALIKALEKRGYEVKVINDSWGEKTNIIKEGEKVEISLREQTRKVPRELTAEEKKKPPYLLNIPEEYHSSGKLSIKINYHYSSYAVWNDRKNEPLENRLNEITACIISVLERLVEEKHQKQEEERRRQEAIRRREEEKRLREQLEADAQQWRKSQIIRGYLNAYEARLIELNGEFIAGSQEADWLKWAREYADSIDPLNKIPPNSER